MFSVLFPKMISNKRIPILLLLLLQVQFQVSYSQENLRKEDVKTKATNFIQQGPSIQFPLDFEQVMGDARNVFGNVVGKMLANKRLVGFDANNWYW